MAERLSVGVAVARRGGARWRIAAAGLAGLAVLAGCASVPDSGNPVAVHNRKLEQDDEPLGVDVNARLPVPGVNLDETITNYVDAARVTQSRPRLAETFISGPKDEFLAAKDVVIVRSLQPAVMSKRDDSASVKLTGQLVGTVNGNGVFTPAQTPFAALVGMVRVSGVWKFTRSPPVIVRDTEFNIAMSNVVTFFAGPATDSGGTAVVVPEVRYLDSSITGPAQATPIVRMLLGGPSGWLNGAAARNPLPTTTLRSNVTIDSSGIEVDLSPDVESASADSINAFAAEVGWTLHNRFPGRLRLLVNGRPIAVSGVQSTQTTDDWARYNPADVPAAPAPLYYVDRGAVKLLDPVSDDGLSPPKMESPQLSKGVIAAAVSDDLSRVAAVRTDAGGKFRLWLGDPHGELGTTLLVGAPMSRPSWGRGSEAVLVACNGGLWRVGPDRVPQRVPVSGTTGPIRQIRVAPDGLRAALVVGDGPSAKAYVALLTRPPGADGGFTLSRLRELKAAGGSVSDVGWYDLSTVAVAVQDDASAGSAVLVPIDGSPPETRRKTPPRPGPVALAAIPTDRQSPIMIEVGKQLFWLYASGPSTPGGLSGGSAPFYPG